MNQEINYNSSDTQGEYFNSIGIDGSIIKAHSSLNTKYFLIKLNDGRYLMREEKFDLINIDLTSGFLGPEMQEYCLNVVDYLSMIKDLESELGVNLTRHYNRIAGPLLYLYSLSKSGGKAANTVKSHYQIASQYVVNDYNENKNQKKDNPLSGFFSAMPKPNVKLVGEGSRDRIM